MWDWAIWGALIAGRAPFSLRSRCSRCGACGRGATSSAPAEHLLRGLDEIAAKGEATAGKAAAAGETDELQRSLLRLRRSLAQLAVLREAIDEVQDAFGRARRAHAAQVIVAAIDLGTNTTRLLVADVDGGRCDELHRETRITRLGEGVDRRRRLLPVPIARVRNALADYRRDRRGARGAERTLAGRDERRPRRGERRGVPRRDRVELRLRDPAASAARRRRRSPAAASPPGPSTPGTLIARHRRRLDRARRSTTSTSASTSARVRLTERFLHGDPPTPASSRACGDAVRAELPASRARAGRRRRRHGDDARRARPRARAVRPRPRRRAHG